MLAAAAAAEWDRPAPEELIMAWDCQHWNTLPEPGGLLDQPAGLVQRMNIALNIFDSYESRLRAIMSDVDMQKWSEDNPRAWKIVGRIERVRFDQRKGAL